MFRNSPREDLSNNSFIKIAKSIFVQTPFSQKSFHFIFYSFIVQKQFLIYKRCNFLSYLLQHRAVKASKTYLLPLKKSKQVITFCS